LLTITRVTNLLNSRSHSTELATAAQNSQSRQLKLTVENACCKICVAGAAIVNWGRYFEYATFDHWFI